MKPPEQAFPGPGYWSGLTGMPPRAPKTIATAQSPHSHIRAFVLRKINLRSFKIVFLVELYLLGNQERTRHHHPFMGFIFFL